MEFNPTTQANTSNSTLVKMPLNNLISAAELNNLIVQLLEDKKAEDIVLIDLKNRNTFVDYMIIATGLSGRQVSALGQYIARELKQRKITVESNGLTGGEWVLLDVGSVFVHIFKPQVRQFYNLEEIWLKSYN